jgi:hypothetical membrane protein
MIKQILLGDFSRSQLKRYIIFHAVIVWLFVMIAWLFYPPAEYSIMEHTFSYLGSFDADRNPEGWYFFSVALICMGILFIPLVLYRARKIAPIEKGSVVIITFLFIIGCLGMAMVGIFPDTGVDFFADLENRQMHNLMAALGFGGFALAIIWESLLMGKDRFKRWPGKTNQTGKQLLNHQKLQIPYIIQYLLIILTGIFVGGWEIVYPIMKENDPSLSHWPGVGVFSFPLWEWILIAYLFGFMYLSAWFLAEE